MSLSLHICFLGPVLNEAMLLPARLRIVKSWELPLKSIRSGYKEVQETFFCWFGLPLEGGTA